jgi:hypothetical protein
MPRFDVQKFALQAAEEGIVNLDVSLGTIVKSRAFESLQGYEDPWIIWCGNDLRLFIWPGPRPGFGFLDRGDLAQQVRESLG